MVSYRLLIIACLVLPFNLMAQTTWYISTSGNDANDGQSINTSLATINKAISLSECGDSIYVLAGTYNEKISAAKICPNDNRVVVQGDNSSRPTIIGDANATNKYAISALGAGFTFRHFLMTSPFPDVCSQQHQVIVGNGSHFTFDNIIVDRSGYDGIKTYGDCLSNQLAINWKIINSVITNCGLGCPKSIVNGDGIDLTTCQDCLIENSIIKDNQGHQLQIKLQAKNVNVIRSHIEGERLIQLGLPGTVVQCDPTKNNAENVSIIYNTILAKGDTSEFVFKLSDVKNLNIQNNTVVKDSIRDIDVGFFCFGGCGGSAAWTNTPKQPIVIKNNIFYSKAAVPFTFGPDTTFFDPFQIYASEVTADFNLFYNDFDSYKNPVDQGANSIVGDPLFCDYPNSFRLQGNSPALDAGDPNLDNDPDGSRSDIGASIYQNDCMVATTEIKNLASLTVFPNPFSDKIYIQFNKLESNSITFQLFNADGKLLMVSSLSQSKTNISVQSLPDGVYFYQINQAGISLKRGKLLKFSTR